MDTQSFDQDCGWSQNRYLNRETSRDVSSESPWGNPAAVAETALIFTGTLFFFHYEVPRTASASCWRLRLRSDQRFGQEKPALKDCCPPPLRATGQRVSEQMSPIISAAARQFCPTRNLNGTIKPVFRTWGLLSNDSKEEICNGKKKKKRLRKAK